MEILVDTHKIYSKLIEAGFEHTKADAITEAFSMLKGNELTKVDIGLIRQELDALRRDLSIHLWAVGATVIGVMAAFNFLG